MSKDTIEVTVAAIGCIIGLVGAVTAVVTRWRSSIEKGYAAERDFAHLRKNQEQISHGIAQIDKDLDARLDRLDLAVNRIESMLHSLLARQRDER